MKFRGISDSSFVPAGSLGASADSTPPAPTPLETPPEADEFWNEDRAAAQVRPSRNLNAAPDCPCSCEGCAESEHCGGPDCLIEEV